MKGCPVKRNEETYKPRTDEVAFNYEVE